MTPAEETIGRHRLHAFGDGAELAEALAGRVAAALADAISRRGYALIAVSGGSTPKAFFQALSKQELDWEKVTVTLVDERLVPPANDRSNHRLVGTYLLQNNAADAGFLPIYRKAESAAAAADMADGDIAALPLPFDVVVLGMGTDGHTASFFPGGDNLANATDPKATRSVVAMEAPDAGEPRLTLTLPLLTGARFLALHIEGEEKRKVLEAALLAGPESEMPIRAVLNAAPGPVDIYWAS